MNQADFEQKYEHTWKRIEIYLIAKEPAIIRSGNDKKKLQELLDELSITQNELLESDFPTLFRQVCHHLSLAKSRQYSPYLIERLDRLVIRAHQLFYRKSLESKASFIKFLFHDFPATVRQESVWVWMSAIVFFLPLIGIIIAIQFWPEFVFSIMSPSDVHNMETMYDPSSSSLGRERESDSDTLMFGFYIYNNTSIGFRTFATGFLLGIGSIFTLVFNALYIGAAAGHLTHIGYTTTFWSFVAGHSAMELMAVVLSGAAGLKLGFSLLMPGRKSRYQALVDAAAIAVKIVAGAAIMFFIAAFIEAYWSSSTNISPYVKYAVGLFMWLVVLGFLIFAGRQPGASADSGIS